jgi:hypothetical protein
VREASRISESPRDACDRAWRFSKNRDRMPVVEFRFSKNRGRRFVVGLRFSKNRDRMVVVDLRFSKNRKRANRTIFEVLKEL